MSSMVLISFNQGSYEPGAVILVGLKSLPPTSSFHRNSMVVPFARSEFVPTTKSQFLALFIHLLLSPDLNTIDNIPTS